MGFREFRVKLILNYPGGPYIRRQEGRVEGDVAMETGERGRTDHAPPCTGTEPDEGTVSQGCKKP